MVHYTPNTIFPTFNILSIDYRNRRSPTTDTLTNSKNYGAIALIVSHSWLIPRSINESLEAHKSLMDAGIPVFNSFIRAYKVIERAPLDGLPIIQAKGRNAKAAAADYRQVADELLRELK